MNSHNIIITSKFYDIPYGGGDAIYIQHISYES